MDGYTSGYPSKPETRNGIAFRLIKQYTVTLAPGLDLDHKRPTGAEKLLGAYDFGATVPLDGSTHFTTEHGVFAGWKTSIPTSPHDNVVHFFPIGTNMTMFGQNVKLDAYWMDVELEVAATPYDPDLNLNAYTFGHTATLDTNGKPVTLLFRANVLGNSQYPYSLTCEGATPAYGSQLTGAIDKFETSKFVYFTKTYTPDKTTQMKETVTMGHAKADATIALTVPPTVHTVTFEANGGTGSMAPVMVPDGDTFTLPACTFTPPQGAEFKAWRTNGKELAVGETIPISGDITLTAVWQKVALPQPDPDLPKPDAPAPVIHTVTFDPNGGTGSMAPVMVPDGHTLTLPVCTFTAPKGMEFKSWVVDGKEFAPGQPLTISGDMTISALWHVSPHQNPNVPQTGDTSSLVLWTTLAALCTVALTTAVIIRKKNPLR